MNSIKEIVLPQGFIIDKIEDNKIILKEKEDKLPTSWEEYKGSNYLKCNKELNAMMSPIGTLARLLVLRDVYRGDWKPDWENKKQLKHTLSLSESIWTTKSSIGVNKLFAFQSAEIRNMFYCNFKSLLEKIKPLFE